MRRTTTALAVLALVTGATGTAHATSVTPRTGVRDRRRRVRLRGHRRRAVRRRSARGVPAHGRPDQRRPGRPASSSTSATSRTGRRPCTDDYFAMIRGALRHASTTPLVYTPGDNEWTDCHRANNGAYDPLERLATVRETFFATPGRDARGRARSRSTRRPSSGHPRERHATAGRASRSSPRTSSAATTASRRGPGLHRRRTPEQRAGGAGADRRRDRRCVNATFDGARQPATTGPSWSCSRPTCSTRPYAPKPSDDLSAFQPPRSRRWSTSRRTFAGPVYLIDGDSHTFNTDRPLATGSSWLSTYHLRGAADNLTRVTVDGSSNNTDYLRVTVGGPGKPVLSWERVPYTS